MGLSESFYTIIEENNCPLYDKGDLFSISDIVMHFPEGKPTCLTLIGDIEIFKQCEDFDDAFLTADSGETLNCSGCTGKIRIRYQKGASRKQTASAEKKPKKEISRTMHILNRFPFFQTFDEENIQDLIASLKMKKYEKGDIVIRKGDSGEFLFIIISGKVDVLGEKNASIATLGVGEVFGEMSLLSGDPVGATIQVIEPSKILCLDGEYFRKLLNKQPALQFYISRLLARRLAKTNIERQAELVSGIAGNISEMHPSVLFQTLNLNQKNGVLKMDTPDGNGVVFFAKGEVIGSEFGKWKGKRAFFELLKVRRGRFQFYSELPDEKKNEKPIGEFMGILMDGVRRIDETTAAK